MASVIRKLAVRLLLGWGKEEVFDIILIGGKPYLIKIQLHESADKFIARMEKALQEQGLKN